MRDRSELHDLLKEILDSDHVYFQPPTSVQMEYPAIVYKRDIADAKFADNIPHSRTQRYLVTHISKAADSPVIVALGDLPMCRTRPSFVTNNLNHDVFELYF